MDCNCSLCRRYGARWCYTQRAAIEVTARRGDVVAYRWGTARIDFNRCRHCGCVVYWQQRRAAPDGSLRVGINTRMMDPADLAGVRVRRLDGAETWKYLD